MNTRDLLELCQLDALGLLDEQEREEFDAAFGAAGPALQAQIRAEQARLVKTDWIPCEAQPSAALREAVLGEMSLAMRIADLRPRVLGAIHDEMIRRPVLGAPRLHEAGRAHPPMLPVRRVSRLWRAAALGFASASVAFAGTTLYLKGLYQELDRTARNNAGVADLVSAPGVRTKEILFEKPVERRLFASADAKITAKASVFVNRETTTAHLYVHGLPDVKDLGKDYRVVALDDEGVIGEELARFPSNGIFDAQDIELGGARRGRIAIVEASLGAQASEGRILLISETLA